MASRGQRDRRHELSSARVAVVVRIPALQLPPTIGSELDRVASGGCLGGGFARDHGTRAEERIVGRLTPGCSGPGARFARTSAAEPER